MAVVFVWAGVVKIIAPYDFADVIAGFQVLPITFIYPVAITLPWLEILMGGALLFPYIVMVRAVAFGLIMLNTIFILLLSIAWLRGLNVHCGCFGLDFLPPSEWSIPLAILRDVILMIFLAFIYRDALKRSSQLND